MDRSRLSFRIIAWYRSTPSKKPVWPGLSASVKYTIHSAADRSTGGLAIEYATLVPGTCAFCMQHGTVRGHCSWTESEQAPMISQPYSPAVDLQRWADQLEGQAPQDILRWALDR